MSRGHGRIQLQVLEFLLRYDEAARAHGDTNAYVAIVEIAGVGATRSRIESVRRAAKSLADEGLILLGSDESPQPASRDRRLNSVNHSYGLMVRLATHAEEQGSSGAVQADSELSA